MDVSAAGRTHTTTSSRGAAHRAGGAHGVFLPSRPSGTHTSAKESSRRSSRRLYRGRRSSCGTTPRDARITL
eukprot:94724-Prymnesium_polylepis.1